MPTNYFDERIAKSYEARWPELFEPAMVDPVVAFLAELAGTGAALEPGGCFVVEVLVPELQRLPPGETVRAFTRTRRTWASTSTTSRRKAWSPTTTGWSTASSGSARCRSATSGRRSWT